MYFKNFLRDMAAKMSCKRTSKAKPMVVRCCLYLILNWIPLAER